MQLLLAGLRALCAVLGASLTASVDALRVEGAADDVVTNTGKVLDTAAADHDDGVLLEVVADTGDISGDLVAVGQANTGDLTQCGVRLLRSGSTNSGADAALLGGGEIGLAVLQGVEALLHGGRRGLVGDFLSALSPGSPFFPAACSDRYTAKGLSSRKQASTEQNAGQVVGGEGVAHNFPEEEKCLQIYLRKVHFS